MFFRASEIPSLSRQYGIQPEICKSPEDARAKIGKEFNAINAPMAVMHT
jgi:hypothetical protein